MTRQKQPDSPYFRWQALEKLHRTAAVLAVMVAAGVIVLVAYSFAAPARAAETPARPHNAAPFAFLYRPTATPTRPPTSTPKPPTPTFTPTPFVPRVGIVAGHRGNDVGALCPDGLNEAQINYDVAGRTAFEMRLRGYTVDVLDEFDPRLNGYRALLLVSIHADSCEYINDQATGFKVARVLDSQVPATEDKLVNCLTQNYAARTSLRFHKNSITRDMTAYHSFYEIAPETPGAIIEIGFMRLDRAILTQRADLVAQGIVDGMMCFLNARSAP